MDRIAVRLLCVLGLWLAQPGVADPNLGAFLDGVVEAERQRAPFAGAVVAVVQDGRVLALRGYGLADIEDDVAVDPSDTLFRVGSVSKVFVWLRLSQLIDAGELELESDVRELIELPTQLRFDEALTVRDLMTHRSGFEDRVIRLFAQGQRTAGDLDSALRDLAPRQVNRPGTVTAYSNYASSLAARVIEAVDGEAWEASIERHVFAPAGASSTSYEQPLPPELRSRVASGYRLSNGQLEEMPYEFFRLSPAGALSSTGSDMAALMVAMLESDRGFAASAQRLFARADDSRPEALSAATFGLYERPQSSVRAVAHDGSLQFAQARLVLWPSERTGLFVAVNAANGLGVAERVERAFAERIGLQRPGGDDLLPVTSPDSYIGHYITTRRAHSTPASLGALVDWVTVSDAGNGNLRVVRPDGEFLAREVSNEVLQEVRGYRRLGRTSAGRMVLAEFPVVEYERVSHWLQPNRQVALVGGALALGALFLLSAVASVLGVRAERGGAGRPLTTLLLVVLAFGWIGFFVLFGQQFSQMDALFRGEDELLRGLLWMPVGLALGSFFGVLLVLFSWLSGSWTLRFRLLATLTAIAFVGLSVWCVYWRLLPSPLNAML